MRPSNSPRCTRLTDQAPLREPAAAERCRTSTVEDRPLDEAELVALAKRGDLRAYGELVEQHQTIAFRTAWLITGSAADAEEAAQDAFLKAHAALGRFRSGAPFRPWVLKIVANEARNRRAAAGRRERLVLRAAEERRPGDAVPSPEAALLDAERHAELVATMERLDERDRVAIACRYFLDLSEAETAAALGVARGTVKSRLSRALDRLRGELQAGGTTLEVGDA
jgi:RNA polymerase sigma factor (sigma-70 family)